MSPREDHMDSLVCLGHLLASRSVNLPRGSQANGRNKACAQDIDRCRDIAVVSGLPQEPLFVSQILSNISGS